MAFMAYKMGENLPNLRAVNESDRSLIWGTVWRDWGK